MPPFFSRIKTFFTQIITFLKGLGTKQKWVAALIAVVVVGGIGYVAFGPRSGTDDQSLSNELRAVELIPVSANTGSGTNSTNAAGVETVMRAETSGKIIQVLPIGTRVSAGSTVALFENAGQQASLLQAEGALESAKASLQKTQGGIRSEKLAVLQTAVQSSENSAVATLLSSFGTVDSAIRDTADQVFSNPESSSPHITFASSNSQRRTELENQRAQLGKILTRESAVATSLSNDSDLKTELTSTENEIRQVRSFIDSLIAALNEAIATGSVTENQIAGYKTSATAARSALTAALSSISGARGSLETAEKNLEEGLAGAEDTDLAAAAAAVKQAQGAYNAARAAYQKTIVSASVSGTIVSCNATSGDVLTVGNDVCRIKSAGAAAGSTFTLPLSSVKYTPTGAFVFVVDEDGSLEAIPVETGLVTAEGIVVTGLFGDEHVVKDVRGLKTGEHVTIQ